MTLNVVNLTLLRDKLLEVAADDALLEHFDMETWGDLGPTEGPLPDLTKCGTSACALGWGTTIPALGLRFFRARFGVGVTDSKGRTPAGVESCYASEGSHAAACRVFGLTLGESEHLFAPSEYLRGKPSPTEVAERIDQLIAEHQEKKPWT